MKQKKFMDIERLKASYVDGFQNGDYIVIQEKIDGANFSLNTMQNLIRLFLLVERKFQILKTT
jgi:hypothetical protein